MPPTCTIGMGNRPSSRLSPNPSGRQSSNAEQFLAFEAVGAGSLLALGSRWRCGQRRRCETETSDAEGEGGVIVLFMVLSVR